MIDTPCNLPDMLRRDLFGNNRWARPKTRNICWQLFGQLLQEIKFETAEHLLKQRIFAVIGRTNPPFDIFPPLRLTLLECAKPPAFCASQTFTEGAPVASEDQP